MIRIHEILDAQRILTDLQSTQKPQVLREMTERLAQLGLILDVNEIYLRLVEREELMTTGVKTGFAFPHAFSAQFDQSFLTIGVSRQGVKFEALDGSPVHYIFLLLGPPHHQAMHLRILARISRLTGQSDMFESLQAATTPEEVMELMNDTERRLTAYSYKIAGTE